MGNSRVKRKGRNSMILTGISIAACRAAISIAQAICQSKTDKKYILRTFILCTGLHGNICSNFSSLDWRTWSFEGLPPIDLCISILYILAISAYLSPPFHAGKSL